MSDHPAIRHVVELGTVFVVYFLLVLGMVLWTDASGAVPAILPANGVLLGYLLARPERLDRKLLLTGLVANLSAHMAAGQVPLTALVLGAIDLLEIALAMVLARRRPGLHVYPNIKQPGDLVHYLVQACLVASLPAALLAAGFLSWREPDSFPITGLALWLAEFLGLATAGVFTMELLHPKFSAASSRPRRLALLLTVCAVSAAIAWIVFSQNRYPLLYLFAVVMMGAAYITGLRGAAAGILSVAGVASWLTASNFGPLTLIPGNSTQERMLALQLFLFVGAITILPFTSVGSAMNRQRATSQDMLSRMMAIMATAPVGITFTRDRTFELVSSAFETMFGYARNSLVGQSPRIIFESDQYYLDLGPRVGAAFQVGQPFIEEIEVVRRDGSRFWGRLQSAPVRAGDPSAGTIWIVEDITEAREARQRLSWSSTHDALTGLVNRKEFEASLGDWLKNSKPEQEAASLFIDLDRFKAVNDSAGHAAGDQILKDVAGLIVHSIRQGDTAARMGGDEFAVLLPACSAEVAERIAEKLCRAVEAHQRDWNGQSLSVGASIGLVDVDARFQNVAGVIAAADAACYAAKHAGRNTVRRG